MKLEVTHTVVYDLDEILPEFIESQGDHDLTIDAICDFVIDRFISPNFDTTGSTRVRIINPYEVYVYETEYGVYCSAECSGSVILEGRINTLRTLVTEHNYPDGITCPACDKVVQYKLGEQQ